MSQCEAKTAANHQCTRPGFDRYATADGVPVVICNGHNDELFRKRKLNTIKGPLALNTKNLTNMKGG